MNILFYLKESYAKKVKDSSKVLYVRLSQGSTVSELSLGVKVKPKEFKSGWFDGMRDWR